MNNTSIIILCNTCYKKLKKHKHKNSKKKTNLKNQIFSNLRFHIHSPSTWNFSQNFINFFPKFHQLFLKIYPNFFQNFSFFFSKFHKHFFSFLPNCSHDFTKLFHNLFLNFKMCKENSNFVEIFLEISTLIFPVILINFTQNRGQDCVTINLRMVAWQKNTSL